MRRRDRVSLAIGGGALVVAVLVIGSALRWTQAIVAVLVAAALLAQFSSRRRLDRLSPIVLILGLAIGFTALQLVPLPTSVIAFFNSAGSELRIDGSALADTSPWPCLSMDPAGTLRGLAFLVTLLGVAVLSLRYATSERGRYLLLAGVTLTCGLAAIVTGVLTLANADSLYGLYAPLHAAPPVLGPLLNPNHLGCLMALGTTLAVGLAFYERQAVQWRVAWVVCSVSCALVTFASLSRGATLSLVLGLAVTGSILIGRSLGDVSRRRRSINQLPIALVIGGGLALAVYAGGGSVAEQLDKTSFVEVNHPASKFAAWKSSIELIAESPWVGVGRGAVEPVFTRVHTASANYTYSHLENEYLQAIVEWGVPGALVLALALAWCIITAIRRWRDGPLAAAALGGIAGIMFQSSVDFGVELLGLAIPLTIVVSTLQLVPLHEAAQVYALRIQRGVMVLALLGASIVLMLPATGYIQEEHDDLTAEKANDKPPSFEELRQSIARHPLDYFAFAMAADEMMSSRDTRAVQFLNHALTLHPSHPGLHRLAARLLLATGSNKPQAAVEYELAMNGTAIPHLLLTEILANLPAANDAASAIPTDYYSPDMILRSLREFDRLDVAQRWLERVVDQPKKDLEVIDQLYDMAMLRKDFDVALRTAKIRMNQAHTNTSSLALARVEFALHEYAAVLHELVDVQTWTNRIDEHGDAWFLVCDSYSEQRMWDLALECIHHLDVTGIVNLRRSEVIKREHDIADQRASEVRLQQIQALERSMNLPVDISLPVVPNHGTSIPQTGPAAAIPNPITNPLTKPVPNPLTNPLRHH